MPGKFDHGDLHAKADAKVGDPLFPGKLGRQDHALYSPVAKAARHQNAAAADQGFRYVFRGQVFGIHPTDLHLGITGRPSMEQRLCHTEVSIPQAGIFPYQGDFHPAVHPFYLLHHGCPFGHIGGPFSQTQPAADGIAQALFFQQQRYFIQSMGRHIGDDTPLLHIAEQSDFMPHLLGDGRLRPANQNIRLDAHRKKLLDRMLGWLAFQLSGAGDGNDERNMDIQHIFPALFHRYLPDGLQIGLAFDIPYRAADLADDHIGVAILHGIDPPLDLIGDMRDDLYRAAEIAPLPLPVQHRPKDLAGGNAGIAVQGFIHKPLIVAQIQVGFGAILGHKDLSVLKGAHGAGINIEIRVELLIFDPQAALLQQSAQGSRADAFAQA